MYLLAVTVFFSIASFQKTAKLLSFFFLFLIYLFSYYTLQHCIGFAIFYFCQLASAEHICVKQTLSMVLSSEFGDASVIQACLYGRMPEYINHLHFFWSDV